MDNALPEGRRHHSAEIVLLNGDGEVLLQLRDDLPHIPYPNIWSLPGGGIEPGESAAATARRELLEETGYVLGDLVFVMTLDWPASRAYYFASRYDGVQPLRCYEGQAVRFVAPAELPSLPQPPRIAGVIRRAARVLGEVG